MSRAEWWALSYTGRALYPGEPSVDALCIEDVAHALALTCRFGGHSPELYSVAQHSVLVSRAIEADGGSVQEQRYGLFHDAPEYVLGDVIWPLKQLPFMIAYKALERRWMQAIVERWKLPSSEPACVRHFDLRLLTTEKRDVMKLPTERAVHLTGKPWHSDGFDPLEEVIVPSDARRAEMEFLERYEELEERFQRGLTPHLRKVP